MQTHERPAEEQALRVPSTTEPSEDSPRAKAKEVYRKSVLQRLGTLRSVAGSDPWLDALP